MKRTDIALGLYLLSAIVFLIIPLPATLLDILLAFNMATALIVVFNALFAKETLDMSGFPTILLFTTVFRIGLNSASTKLILSSGDPGNVVRTFGEFVGGGDIVIGIIVFIIIIIVQFAVINKGSERVAEVTARFTLDAMPGKQMAIDGDLNTGAITDEEAKQKREKLQQESSFYGAMDGAMKYVKGDATAGLLITAVNIIGGIAMAVLRRGMTIGDAFDTYVILTIGDGLVSQIPSLLISLSSGIIVTKASKEEEIGDQIFGELFSIPKVMYMVGGTLAFLGIVTPLSWFIFVPFGGLLILVGNSIAHKSGTEAIEEEAAASELEADEIRKPESVVSLLQVIL